MKLIIFGATGSVGKQLVTQALAMGHHVTGFSRNPEANGQDHDKYLPCAGDVLDQDAVTAAVAGHDAVLIVLGAGRKGTVRSQGTQCVINAMEHHGIRRLICQSTLGVGDSRENLNFFWKRIMFGWLLRDVYADHVAQETIVRNSDLDWIIVRPGAFTDGSLTGVYREGFAPSDKTIELKVSRADVADFMLKQLCADTYLHQSAGLSY